MKKNNLQPTGDFDIESQIMEKIDMEDLKPRSKYLFLAEKFGIGSAMIFTILLAVLFFCLFLFYLQASDNLKYLSFGSRGLFAFLESFPYLMVCSFILLLLLAGLIIKKAGVWYQKPFTRIALGLLLFIVVIGCGLAFSGFPERLEREAFGQRRMGHMFKPFFENNLRSRKNGVAGKVVEIQDNYINVQTPVEIIKIDLSGLNKNLFSDIATTSFVMVVGKKDGNVFKARAIKILNEGEIPMLERGIYRRFGSAPPPPPQNMPFIRIPNYR